MELFILCKNPPFWFLWASGFASLFALIVVIAYFIKPCLK